MFWKIEAMIAVPAQAGPAIYSQQGEAPEVFIARVRGAEPQGQLRLQNPVLVLKVEVSFYTANLGELGFYLETASPYIESLPAVQICSLVFPTLNSPKGCSKSSSIPYSQSGGRHTILSRFSIFRKNFPSSLPSQFHSA